MDLREKKTLFFLNFTVNSAFQEENLSGSKENQVPSSLFFEVSFVRIGFNYILLRFPCLMPHFSATLGQSHGELVDEPNAGFKPWHRFRSNVAETHGRHGLSLHFDGHPSSGKWLVVKTTVAV